MRVSLRGVVPAVVRVIDVPAASTLDELHDVLEVTFGWTDSHPHRFRTDTASYAPDTEWADDDPDVLLADLPPRFGYVYDGADSGDGYEHDVEVLGRGARAPGCVGGEGASPREQSGGPYGYGELLNALTSSSHPRNAADQAIRERVGDHLLPFDRQATTIRVRNMVGAVPDSVRLLLGILAGGIRLTLAGRLPRVVVREMLVQRPDWSPKGRPASVEEHLPSLAALHDILEDAGLVELRGKVLRPSEAAGDELEVVRRLRAWFAPGEFDTAVAERAVAVVVVHGRMQVADVAGVVLPMLGWGWQRGSQPVTVRDVEFELGRMAHHLVALDLVVGGWRVWSPGTAARSLLPFATRLAERV